MKKYIKKCIELNQNLVEYNLTKLTWGNASIRNENKVYIKPSGINVKLLNKKNISIIDIDTNKFTGYKPSVDTPIHLEIYKNFNNINSIIHTHSKYATIWSQCKEPIPILGTTHADCFPEDIPLIDIDKNFNFNDYENNLGKLISNYFISNQKDPANIRAILLANHGAFIFSNSADSILEYAITLEYIAEMAMYCYLMKYKFNFYDTVPQELFKKHFERKNGESKYYGQ